MGLEVTPAPLEIPKLLYAQEGFGPGGPDVILTGAAGVITVVTGIDLYSGGGTPIPYCFIGMETSGQTFFYATSSTVSAYNAQWRGALALTQYLGITAHCVYEPFDITVWGYVIADMSTA